MISINYIFKRIKDQLKCIHFSGPFFGIIIALIILIIAIHALFFSNYPLVMVQFNDQQCVIGEKFDLKWMHSVEKQAWIESYEIDNTSLLLTDTYIETFGAGTPSTERLANKSTEHPGYIRYEINQQLPYLNWMISSNIKAEIITEEKHLPIYQWVDDYTNIYIFASVQNLWTLLRQESCNEYAQHQLR